MSASAPTALDAIWQEVECGGYAADLPLFERVSAPGEPVLDLGAGVGRVSLHLAERGRDVTALDADAALLGALRTRADARGWAVSTAPADARDFDLAARFDLILAPMQLIQLLEAGERPSALACWAAHLAPAGRMAIAIVEEAPPDAVAEEDAPLPDVLERDGWVYSSLPVSVATRDGKVVVERVRQAVSPEGELSETRAEDRLELVGADEIEAEARAAGLRPVERVELPDTDLHVGSTVLVMEGPHA